MTTFGTGPRACMPRCACSMAPCSARAGRSATPRNSSASSTGVEQATAADQAIHVILDNLSTHKSPPVQRWLRRHPRVQFHFIPTSSSWLNLVERWFGEITRDRIRRGTFESVPALIAAIEDYLATTTRPLAASSGPRTPT